jgi:hypothetical protein
VFYERMSRLEWGTEYKGEYYISPHWLNRNRIYRCPEQQGVMTLVTPYIQN